MKKLRKIFSLLFLLILFTHSSKAQVFCDDYSDPAPWMIIGTTTMPSCSAPAGTIGLPPFSMDFTNFAMRQSRVASRPATIPNFFRVEFDFRLLPPSGIDGLLALSLSEVNTPTRSWSGGVVVENPGNTVEIIMSNWMQNGNYSGIRFRGSSKFGATRGVNSDRIDVHKNLKFGTIYVRMERIALDRVVLTLHYDQARTILIGSVCFSIDPAISNLNYIQHGGRAGAGCNRTGNASIDNLCIYDTPSNDPCVDCDLTQISANFNKTFNCSANTGDINLSFTGGTGPNYSFYWSNGMTTQNISNVPPGIYNVIITDNDGCQTIKSTTLSAPSLSIGFNSNFNCTSGTGNITANLSGGTNPLTYLWNTSATTQTISGVGAGTYTVTITDGNGCTKVANKTIGPPNINININSSFNCTANAENLSAGASGGQGPYSYLWSNGPTTSSNNAVGSGTYTVTVTDNNGCTATASFTVGTIPPPLTVTITDVFNCGSNSITLTAGISGGISAYTYSWSGGGSTTTKNVTSSGTYTVTVTDGNGCTQTASITVSVPTAGLWLYIAEYLDCASNQFVYEANPTGGASPYTYNWSTGAITQSIMSVVATTYSVTVTDNNGCTMTGSVVSSVPPPPLAITNIQDVYDCTTNSIDLTALHTGGTGPYSYLWNTSQGSQSINVTSSGTYSVTVTDYWGCTASTSMNFTVSPVLTTTSQATYNCTSNSGSITTNPNGGLPPYSYVWSSGGLAQTETGLLAGTYMVTVTDDNGCSVIDTVDMFPPIINVAIVSTFNCLTNAWDVQANVVGGNGPYNYSWTNGANTANTSLVASGTFTVTVTDVNGCTGVASISVVVPTPMNINILSSVNCANYTTNLTASVGGGAGPLSYVWSNGVLVSGNNGLSNGTYTVTVTDANGCTITASHTVTNPSPLTLNLSTIFNCTLNTGSITANHTGGVGPYTYSWFGTAQTTQTVTGLSSMLYSVTVTDANGCTISGTVYLGPPNFVVNLQTNFNCLSGLGSITANHTGGTAPYTYAWIGTSQTTQTVSGLSPGTYSVTVTDDNGCTATASTTINYPNITATLTTTPTCPNVCNGTLTISSPSGGTAAYTYNLNNQGWSTSTFYSGLCAGNHMVEIMDANGCRNTLSANVGVVTDPWPKHPVSLGTEYSQGNGIDVAQEGRFLTGQFFERIEFANPVTPYNPIVLTSTSGNNEDAYVVRYDDCGAAWAFGFGSINGNEEGVVVRTTPNDADGYQLIVGANINGPLPAGIIDATNAATITTTNGINLITGPVANVSKGLIISVDPSDGSVNWVYMIGNNTSQPSSINDLRVANNQIYAIGNVHGTSFNIGTNSHTLQGGWDILLMSLGMSGSFTTGNSTTWGTAADDNGEALDVAMISDIQSEIITTGFISHQACTVQTSAYPTSPAINGRDVFVGQFLTGTNFPLMNFQIHRSAGDDEGLDIVYPTKASLGIAFAFTGYFEGSLNLTSFNTLPFTHTGAGFGNKDAYVAAYDSNFDRVWSREAVTTGAGIDDIGEAIVFNASNDSIYVAGEYSAGVGGFLLGAFPTISGDQNIFIQRFEAATGFHLGGFVFESQDGTGDQDRAFDIELNSDALFTTGMFGNTGQLDFPTAGIPFLVAASNVHETYFARLSYAGNFFRKGRLIEESKADGILDMRVYPNPFTDQVQVEFSSDLESHMTVMDANGKQVFDSGRISPGSFNQRIDLHGYSKGIYFIRINTSEGVETFKMLKQ